MIDSDLGLPVTETLQASGKPELGKLILVTALSAALVFPAAASYTTMEFGIEL